MSPTRWFCRGNHECGTVRLIIQRELRAPIIVAALILALSAAYYLLWPRYSWQRYIDPQHVFLAVIPEVRDTHEVRHDRDPALLKRLVRALNAGREKFVQIKLAVGGVLVLHRRRGPSILAESILIRYGQARPGGAMLFREPPRASRPGSMDLYRSHALGKALQAIRSSRSCAARRPSVPRRSVSRIELYTGGACRVLSGAGREADRVVGALNAFLQLIDTSFYAVLGDPTDSSFYAGEADPRAHIGAATGALLTLNPPLSMHTTMMFWGTESGPPAEYQEFKTSVIVISDAISLRNKEVVGFSSDAKPNRFYLFYARSGAGSSGAARTAEKWDAIMRAIREAMASPTNPTSASAVLRQTAFTTSGFRWSTRGPSGTICRPGTVPHRPLRCIRSGPTWCRGR